MNRVQLVQSPTPIEYLPNLSKTLNGPQIYIKRDDCTGLASGGNKARKLEYLMADAIKAQADVIVTVGGIQSNHARQTAAAAAKFGIPCELVLEQVEGVPPEHYFNNGNLLLDKILGAKVTICQPGEDSVEQGKKRSIELAHEGKKPYFIPVGGSNPIGALGYVNCANELLDQSEESWNHIILATGSAGTQAGLIAGLAERDSDIPVTGICVSRSTEDQKELVNELLFEMDKNKAQKWQQNVITNGGFVGEGYGIPTNETIEAIQLLAQNEGILLDPVYTGKAMAGLIAMIRSGQFSSDDKVLFLHTGGSAGLFAYAGLF